MTLPSNKRSLLSLLTIAVGAAPCAVLSFAVPPIHRNLFVKRLIPPPWLGPPPLPQVVKRLTPLNAAPKDDESPSNRFDRTATMDAASNDVCILQIDGQRYNLTSWANAHPGGVHLLKFYNNKDASKAFHAVGHSNNAHKMLQEFLIPVASSSSSSSSSATASQPSSAYPANKMITTAAAAQPQWRQKLFTKEDPAGLHKSLGIFCLLHFSFRFFQMYFTDPSGGLGSRLGHGPHVGPAICLLPHALLSLSSLIFHTGK